MTKDELMQLADAYATTVYYNGPPSKAATAKQALSDAIDAALKQARMDALEEAAKEIDRNSQDFFRSEHAASIRALKDVYTNSPNLDTSVERVQIIHDSMHESIQDDIDGHPV